MKSIKNLQSQKVAYNLGTTSRKIIPKYMKKRQIIYLSIHKIAIQNKGFIA